MEINMLADIRDQLTRFEDAMGRQPAFIDGHRHVHQFPVVRELLLEEISRRDPTSLPWLRSTAPGGALRREGLKARVIHALGGPALQRRACARGIPHSRGLLGVYDFGGDADAYRARLYGWLRTARTGDVLMCHPSAALFADPHADARMREYAVLRAIDFPCHGDTCHVRPVPLTELLQHGAGVPWRSPGPSQPSRPGATSMRPSFISIHSVPHACPYSLTPSSQSFIGNETRTVFTASSSL